MEIIEKIRQNIPGLNNMMVALDETMSVKQIRNIIGEFA